MAINQVFYRKIKHMRARIVKPQMMYYGEVYVNGKWKTVTEPCYTECGAKLKLKKWKKENIPNEFEL